MRWVAVFTIIAQVTAELMTEPLVHWSMDLYNNSKLLPDFGDEERYSCDLPESYFKSGVIGNALYSNSKKIKLIEDMWRSDCLRNPVQCDDGLTLSFWLKLKKPTPGKDQAILRTSDPSRRRPGVYIGGIGDKELLFMIRTAEGKRFQASIGLTANTDQWSHFTMRWNSTSGIQVSINSSLLSSELYTESPSVENVRSSYPSKVDFVIGDIPGAVFLLDDLWIFYHKLTDEEVYSLFELGIPKEQPPPDAVTAYNTFQENLTNPMDRMDTTELNQVADMVPSTAASSDSSADDLMTTKPDYPAETTAKISTTSTHSSTKSPTTRTPTTKNASKNANRGVTQGPKTTTTAYSGWFYLQPWYYTVLGVVFLSLLALSTWLCIIHCCVPAVEERKSSKATCEQSIMEPLVQNT